MADIARRFPENPLLSPASLPAHGKGMEITSFLNPGAFRFKNKIWLLIRIAERPPQTDNSISFPILSVSGEFNITEIQKNDPDLIATDARVISYKGSDYLTTLSHLRLLYSDDGIHFHEPEGYPVLTGIGRQESFGIEDCRVVFLENKFHLSYTAVSSDGVGVGLRTTTDWKDFTQHGMILPPHNKDCAIFSEKINGMYYALHRPSSPAIGGNYIWLAESLDGIHWGKHTCIVKTRCDTWDSARVGAGAAPIKTAKGWLQIYHGANEAHRYCLGAFLLDLQDPSKLLARTEQPIMEPKEWYELTGFFGNVVFTNGHIEHPGDDRVTIYYGASDEYVCAADFSLNEILNALTFMA